MVGSVEGTAREVMVAELQRWIASREYESLEILDDAVDAFLWSQDEEPEAADLPAPRPGSPRPR